MKIVNGVQVVDLEISAQQWQVIQAALQELPFKVAQPVLADLQTQVIKQSQPPKGNPPAPVEGNTALPVAAQEVGVAA